MTLEQKILEYLLRSERQATATTIANRIERDVEQCRGFLEELKQRGLVRGLDGKGPSQFVITPDGRAE